jgi:septin family protein
VESLHSIHYYNYRANAMRSKGHRDNVLPSDESYANSIEEHRQAFQEEMMRREEEMRQQFFAKVKEKEAQLRQQEEALAQRQQKMDAELEGLRRQLELEQQEYEALLAQRTAAQYVHYH